MRLPPRARAAFVVLLLLGGGCRAIAGLEDHELLVPPQEAGPPDTAAPDAAEIPLADATVVAKTTGEPYGIATDDVAVYWASGTTFEIFKQPLDAGANADAARPFLGGLPKVREVHLTPAFVIAPIRRQDQCALVRARKDGTTAGDPCVVNHQFTTWNAQHGALRGSSFFLALEDSATPMTRIWEIKQIETQGKLTFTTTAPLESVAVCVLRTTEVVTAVAADDTEVFVGTEGGQVFRAPWPAAASACDDPAATPFVRRASRIESLVVDADVVYGGDGEGVWRAPKADAARLTVIARAPSVKTVRLDGGNVWFTTQTGDVRRVPADGTGDSVLIARDAPGLFGLSVTPSSIWFTNTATKSILQAPRPR